MTDAATGVDVILGLGGRDTLVGRSGADTLDGGAASDALLGGSGNDLLIDNLGRNRLDGGAGGDTYRIDNVLGADGGIRRGDLLAFNTCADSGGTGTDAIVAVANRGALALIGLADFGPESGIESIQGVARPGYKTTIIGSEHGDGDDRITGSDQPGNISGDGGDDTIEGGGGNDFLWGGRGNDLFLYGSTPFGDDRIADFLPGDRLELAEGVTVDFGIGTSVLALTDGSGILGTITATNGHLWTPEDVGIGNALQLGALTGTNGFTIRSSDDDVGNLGVSVAGAGDVNADGLGDLAIRAHGRAFVLFGSTQTRDPLLDLADLDGANAFDIRRGGDFVPSPALAGAGDIDGDGVPDLVIGAFNALGAPGEVYAVLGEALTFG